MTVDRNTLEKTAVPPNAAVSLIRGGPFYSAQLKTWLIHRNQWNVGKRIIFAIAIGWVLMVLMTAVFQPGAIVGLLTDYEVSSKMLIAAPVLLLGQALTVFDHV